MKQNKLSELTLKYKQGYTRLKEIPSVIAELNDQAVDVEAFFDDRSKDIVQAEMDKVQVLNAEMSMLLNKVLPALKLSIKREIIEIQQSIIAKMESERDALEATLDSKTKEFNRLLAELGALGSEIFGTKVKDKVTSKINTYVSENLQSIGKDSSLTTKADYFDQRISTAINQNNILAPYFDTEITQAFEDMAVKETPIEIKTEEKIEVTDTKEKDKVEEKIIDYNPEFANQYRDELMQIMNL